MALPLGELVDALFHGLDSARRRSLKTLCGCLADDLDRLVTGDPGTREAARLKAEQLVGSFGLSDAAFAEQDLDPARAAEAVLAHGHFATPSETTELREPVRRILACFNERLPARPELLADLLPHIHQATLRRLRRIEDEQRRQGEEQRRQTALLQQIAAAVATAERVPNEVLQEILSRFGESEIAADRAIIGQRLRAKAEEYRALEARLRRLSNDDPDVGRLRRQAADLIAAADFPAAAASALPRPAPSAPLPRGWRSTIAPPPAISPRQPASSSPPTPRAGWTISNARSTRSTTRAASLATTMRCGSPSSARAFC